MCRLSVSKESSNPQTLKDFLSQNLFNSLKIFLKNICSLKIFLLKTMNNTIYDLDIK